MEIDHFKMTEKIRKLKNKEKKPYTEYNQLNNGKTFPFYSLPLCAQRQSEL